MSESDSPYQNGPGMDRLAGFHHTISEQLNARLAESPRFFAVLVVASTAYGFVLWNFGPETRNSAKNSAFLLVSVVAYAAGLWSHWYLAALGYAFRFLQNTQHRIEEALGWDSYRPRGTGNPPERITTLPRLLWLLPGIYHAHFFGLSLFLVAVIGSFWWHWPNRHTVNYWTAAALVIAAVTIFSVNYHYLTKFKRKRVPQGTGPPPS